MNKENDFRDWGFIFTGFIIVIMGVSTLEDQVMSQWGWLYNAVFSFAVIFSAVTFIGMGAGIIKQNGK